MQQEKLTASKDETPVMNLLPIAKSFSKVIQLPKLLLLMMLQSLLNFNSQAQSTPTDLTLLGIEDILTRRIIPHDQATGKALPPERWSFGYDFVTAHFKEYQTGTRTISTAQMQTLFPVLPLEIIQRAHLLNVGYQVTDRLFLDLQVSYVQQSTYHISRVPGFDEFTIRSHGVGDTSIGLNYMLWSDENESLYAGAALSIPTGDINKKGRTPRDAVNDTLLPYTMQIGSGTFDFNPSINYIRKMDKFEWSNNLQGTIRMGKNYHDYSLSHRAILKTTLSYEMFPFLHPSVKLLGHYWDRIHGQDNDVILPGGIFPAPVTNPDLFGGRKVDLLFGLRIPINNGLLKGQILELEGGFPIYQYLNGPQPGEQWRLAASWKWRF